MSEMHPRLLILSPHFGDAVFGCGTLLASYPDTAVCTVFAAAPEHDVHPHADAECGFDSAHDALRTRRREDDDALAVLDAIPIRLPFSDRQYLDPPTLVTLTAALEEAIYGSTANTLVMPLGLPDADHELVYDACCELLPRLSHLTWFGYEEAFCHERPGLGERRLAELARRGIAATPAQPDTRSTRHARCSRNATRRISTRAACTVAKRAAARCSRRSATGGSTRSDTPLAPGAVTACMRTRTSERLCDEEALRAAHPMQEEPSMICSHTNPLPDPLADPTRDPDHDPLSPPSPGHHNDEPQHPEGPPDKDPV